MLLCVSFAGPQKFWLAAATEKPSTGGPLVLSCTTCWPVCHHSLPKTARKQLKRFYVENWIYPPTWHQTLAISYAAWWSVRCRCDWAPIPTMVKQYVRIHSSSLSTGTMCWPAVWIHQSSRYCAAMMMSHNSIQNSPSKFRWIRPCFQRSAKVSIPYSKWVPTQSTQWSRYLFWTTINFPFITNEAKQSHRKSFNDIFNWYSFVFTGLHLRRTIGSGGNVTAASSAIIQIAKTATVSASKWSDAFDAIRTARHGIEKYPATFAAVCTETITTGWSDGNSGNAHCVVRTQYQTKIAYLFFSEYITNECFVSFHDRYTNITPF